ncbi:hypothetical protein LUX39_00205 [Actinomadura madurae]|nr:hypothetical protein [Actinomadura madurae]MCQ0012472.1 hypothetical protein [Actinomadura madurae]
MEKSARPLRLKRRVRRRAHRVLRRSALWALRPLRLRPIPPRGERLRVRILLQNAHGTGGTIRTVLNLSGHLARDHDVEIVSVLKRSRKPFFPIPAGVRVTYADDGFAPKGRAARLLSRLPSVLTPVDEASFRLMNLWSDLCLLRAVYGTPADVLMPTRPSLNLLVAELGPRGAVTIGQDHMSLESYQPWLRREILRRYRRLTVVTTLTEAARRRATGPPSPAPACGWCRSRTPPRACRPARPGASTRSSWPPGGSCTPRASTCSSAPSRRSPPTTRTGRCASSAEALGGKSCSP